MNDQISRQKLIEELDELDHWTQFAEHWFRCDAVYSLIRRQPPADVPDTNVGEYIDTGCMAEIIHTVGEKKIPRHLKLIKDDEIVKEFILCKNPVGHAGYYETVAGVFYRIDMEENGND